MGREWDYWEARDAWEASYYIVKDPPIAWGFMFEDRLAYGGEDFDIGFTYEELLALYETVHKEVPCWIAKSYGAGEICPEEIDWGKDKPIEWPRPKRTCTPDKPCWGREHCRAQAERPRDQQEIVGLVRSLARSPLSPSGAKSLERYKREKEFWKSLAERSRAEKQGGSAEKPLEQQPKPAMPSTPQVVKDQPAIPWIFLEEVPASAEPKKENRGLAAFRAFVESIWEKTPARWRLKKRGS